ncbi:PAS domain S-box protein [Flavobacterium sp. TSSA_36]|uniref:PAS domain S-box protein n=1 Tax=Flavobacterium sp. TSSA_36 TaxID=3447669 RepID=UPI003F329591
MENIQFHFNQPTFDTIFPFHILINEDLYIKNIGSSLKKMCPMLSSGANFWTFFKLDKPYDTITDLETICLVSKETVTLNFLPENTIRLEGQITKSDSDYLFLGTPIFKDIESIENMGLSNHDFSVHAPIFEYLSDLKGYQAHNEGLKNMLTTVKLEQAVLEKDKQELNKISVVASANKNGVIFCYPDGKIYWCNEAYESLTGYTKHEIYGRTPIEIGKCADTDLEDVKKMVTAFHESKTFDVELLHNTKSGHSFWSRSKGQPIKNENGLTHYFAMIDDITLEKQKEEKLHILSSIADVNINAVIISDKNGNIEWVNKSFEKMTGYTSDEVIGKRPGNFLQGEETDPETVKYLRNQIAKGEPFNCDILNYSKSKQKYWIRVQGQALRDKYGKIFKFFAIEQDVSLEKNFLESIKVEKDKYSNVIASMKMGLLEVNLEDEIVFANQTFCDITGYTISELIGKKSDFFYFNAGENVLNLKHNKTEGIISYEVKVRIKNGTEKYLLISGAPNYNVKGELIGSIGVHLDVTDQKNLEHQKEQLLLRLENQNEQLNNYAQIVAHDLKSPLRSIHALISWIKEDNQDALNMNTLDYLNKIQGKVEKMDHFIQGILTYSKIDTIELTTDFVDVNDIINNLISIIHIPETVTVQIVQKLPTIRADKYRMQQLFQNLIGNAVTYVDKNPGWVKVDFKEDENNYVFSIEDNGPGIAKENQERVFAIFQSFTKNEHSTGIGLSIVKRIIDNYKGEIWIESEVKVGTTFFVRIPKNIF